MVKKIRVRISITGIVQGVGFRPFIYSLAEKCSLTGFVRNDTHGVIIEVEGDKPSVNKFVEEMPIQLPPLAQIETMETLILPCQYDEKFIIKESKEEEEKFVLISPDIATCYDCLNELFNPKDHRYLYPFINCTNCGPRFTIIKDVPYDRKKTTMHKFVMCETCNREYYQPANRRFHAQPNACPKCGPEVILIKNEKFLPKANLRHGGSASGMKPQAEKMKNVAKGTEAIEKTIELLSQGKIVAIKGLGGFHLACDALNEEAVTRLRKRKYREDKPFAMMAKDLETIKKYCLLNETEEKLLLSTRRPILLLKRKPQVDIAETVAPKQKYYGFMLPYTPLHHLLFNQSSVISHQLSVIVMTSGNLSDEPISYKNEEAVTRLKNIADYFLLHNRDIHIRCDDTVTRVFNNKELLIRRARGYVPQPIKLKMEFAEHILACGAELKNTFCLCRDNYAFLSHHIGDLENLETLTSFEQGIEHFKTFFSIEPKIVAYDLHPEYLSTKFALNLTPDTLHVARVGVQHHYAHIISCLADNNLDVSSSSQPKVDQPLAEDTVIGVAFDGLGYGDDGNFWGGEFLLADFSNYQRKAYLKYFPLLGGEQAIKEPWRMAVSYLHTIYGDNFLNLDIPLIKKLNKKNWFILEKMLKLKVNSPLISSIGRLFDCISAILGIRVERVNYEGQAAVELEMIADETLKHTQSTVYEYEINKENGKLIINPGLIVQGVIADLQKNVSLPIISAKFHHTIAGIVLDVCQRIREETKINSVALSGGVFQNIFLLENTVNLLKENNFQVYTHSRVPPNDGGISLGQAVIAHFATQNDISDEKIRLQR